jgi:hypothetical protein
MNSDEFPRGTPWKMDGNLWKSDAFLRGAPCRINGNLWKSNDLPRATPCKKCVNPYKSDAFLRGYPLQNERKSMEIRCIPKGYVPLAKWTEIYGNPMHS